MKNKDTLMLAEAYSNILKEEIADFNNNGPTWDMNMSQERTRTKRIDSDEEDREEENDKFSQLEIGLGRPNPSVEQGDLLQGLSENDARELLNHLNQKGEENEDNWVLKDNLILQLFDLLRNPNI
jgi:hypothetical protein